MKPFSLVLLILTVTVALLAVRPMFMTDAETFAGYAVRDLRDVPMIRFVRISRSGAPLELAEVGAFVGKRNVAPVHGRASQSSTKQNDTLKYGPNLAINGNNTGAKFFHVATTSPRERHHWWLLDLQSEMPISAVTIHLPERGVHPRPQSAWHDKFRDQDTLVEFMDNDGTIVLTKTIESWEEIITFSTTSRDANRARTM